MKVVVQRVSQASVEIEQQVVGAIRQGLCLLVGIAPADTPQTLAKMADKIAHLRIFEDNQGKMNRSVADIKGSILAVSQFTLLADCATGRRPSFTGAGNPQKAEELYALFIRQLRQTGVPVEQGRFGADMRVQLTNEGPATFILESDS